MVNAVKGKPAVLNEVLHQMSAEDVVGAIADSHSLSQYLVDNFDKLAFNKPVDKEYIVEKENLVEHKTIEDALAETPESVLIEDIAKAIEEKE